MGPKNKHGLIMTMNRTGAGEPADSVIIKTLWTQNNLNN